MAVGRNPPWQTNALVLDDTGRATVAFKAFLDLLYERTGGLMANIVTVVASLPTAADVISASVPASYEWVSNDLGMNWLTTSPQTESVAFYDASGATVATQAIVGTRDDTTGFITLSLGAHTGLPVTAPFPLSNGATQVISVPIIVTGSKVQTFAAFSSRFDTTALGGYTGGGSK